MKKPVLVFLALLTLLPFAQLAVQAQPPAAPAAPAPDVAQFLASLSAGQAQAPSDLVPAPSFLTSCTSSSQCPSGQLCCNTCGNPPDGGSCMGCVNPVRGRCPLFV
jgi:hypothetical protein